MKMKPTAMIAVFAAAALIVSGCSSDAGGSSDSTDPSELSGTLSVASWKFLEDNNQEWDVMATYMETRPNVTLEKVAIPYSTYAATLSTQIGSGSGPDLMVLADTHFYPMSSQGAFSPVDGILSPEIEATLSSANAGGNIDGQQLGFVYQPSVYYFFWNKSILEEAGVEPPTNFNEFVTAAKTIKEKTGVWGFAARNMLGEEQSWFEDFTGTFLLGNGGAWAENGKLTIDTPANVKAVEAFEEMYSSGAMVIGEDASTFRAKFKQGQVAMMLDNQAAASTMIGDVVKSEDMGVGPTPFSTVTTGNVIKYLAVNNNNTKDALTKDFLNWLYSPEIQEEMAAGSAPNLMGTTTLPPASYVEANPWAQGFWDQIANSTTILVPGFEAVSPQIGHAIMPQIARVLAGQISAAEALKQAQVDAEAAVK